MKEPGRSRRSLSFDANHRKEALLQAAGKRRAAMLSMDGELRIHRSTTPRPFPLHVRVAHPRHVAVASRVSGNTEAEPDLPPPLFQFLSNTLRDYQPQHAIVVKGQVVDGQLMKGEIVRDPVEGGG